LVMFLVKLSYLVLSSSRFRSGWFSKDGG
jgi:hypothetical protein